MTEHPLIRLNPGQERRLKSGHPWAYSNEIRMQPEMRQMPAGGLARLEGDDGWRFGTFAFNPHSLIGARLLDRDPAACVDAAWVRRRIAAAVALRARITDGPFHRLVHAEADLLPGLVIDRYGGVAVLQANSAWADRMTPEIVAALLTELDLRSVVARNDSPVRAHEGLSLDVALLHGREATAVVEEGGVRFGVDPLSGQKTGWFFDQRRNRDMVAGLAAGARVLDVFCHVGAFGLRCAAAGAAEVTLVEFQRPGAGTGAGGGGRERIWSPRAGAAGRCVRCHDRGGAGRGTLRHRGVRPAGVREVEEGPGGGAARLWADGTAGGAAGGAGRFSVRGVVQPPCGAGGICRGDCRRGAAGAAWRAHSGDHRRGSGPSGASAFAGECVFEGAVAAGGLNEARGGKAKRRPPLQAVTRSCDGTRRN